MWLVLSFYDKRVTQLMHSVQCSLKFNYPFKAKSQATLLHSLAFWFFMMRVAMPQNALFQH